MTASKLIKDYEGEATYQIIVRGKVDPLFIHRINSFSVTHIESERKTLSTLTGKIADQEALSGLLNILFDHQFPVISVMKIDN
jgi:hypothetical protein